VINVNLITGFLGSGKTTTLQHLLKQKPLNEKWAVLINEFGEIGIDGALLAESGAILKEIPGGCMCCVNGLPMQVGLNMLIKQAKPDRILIEPTGLGHPKQILALLSSAVYDSFLNVQAVVCLLDARQLNDSRYSENENFRDQLAAADVVIANKSDRYSESDNANLADWHNKTLPQTPLIKAIYGKIDPQLLSAPHVNQTILPDAQHHRHSTQSSLSKLELPQNVSWRRALNEGQGYVSCGWIFDSSTCFTTLNLLEWVRLSPVDRVKGVMRIPEGTLIVNRQGEDFSIETRPTPPIDSRIELIHRQPVDWNKLQHALLSFRLASSGESAG
jgi:G3E family GTPase